MPWSGYLLPLLTGAKVTAEIAIASTALGVVAAFVAGIARASGGRVVRAVAAAYVEIFRGTSLLVQLFWLYYALPLIGPSIGPIETGILALALNIGAYGAEVVRGAIVAVPREQYEAATTLNFGRRHTLWHIVLPQALPEMLPPLGNFAVQNLKDTSLVSMITISDLTYHAEALRNLTFASVPIYTLTLLLYFAMALVLMAGMRTIEAWVGRRGGLARAAHA